MQDVTIYRYKEKEHAESTPLRLREADLAGDQ